MMAALAMVVSCGSPEDVPTPGNGTLAISADKLEIIADGQDSAQITVEYDGKTITEDVSFYDPSTNVPVAVKSMRFSTKTAGQHSFYATYNGVKSNTLTINALEYAVPEVPKDADPSNTSFKKRVLMTQFTSTGCTYCPIVSGLLKELSVDPAYADRFVLGASHADMPGYLNGDDPASYSGATGFMNAFGVTGFPWLNADFGDILTKYDISAVRALVDGCYGDGKAAAGISVNSAIQGNVLVVRAAVKAGVTGSYRVGLWLLEDGIYGKQTSAPDESYNTHNNCIRLLDAGTSYMGHSVGKLAAGGVGEHIFTIKNLDSEWKLDKCKLLIYVTSSLGTSQVVNNAVIVPIGKPVGYEYK